jgi:hypothetical protein
MASQDRLDLVADVKRQVFRVELLLAFIGPLIAWHQRQCGTESRMEADNAAAPGTDTVDLSDAEQAAFDRSARAYFAMQRKSADQWRTLAGQARHSHADAAGVTAADADLVEALLNTAGVVTVLAELLDALATTYLEQVSLSPAKVALLQQHLDRWSMQASGLSVRLAHEG